MKRTSDPVDFQIAAQRLEITKQIPASQLAALMGSKDPVEFVLGEVSEEALSELNAHWYESVLVSLAYNPKNKVIEVNICATQAQQLAHPHPGIECGQNHGAKPSLRTLDGFPIYQPGDLLFVEDD